MYLLRDENEYDFIKLIDNKGVTTTVDMFQAITFSDIDEAKLLKEYIQNISNDYNLQIVEIELKEVE